MKQAWTLSLLLIVALVGCNKPKPVVVLDGWWNADYAKETCRHANEWYRENTKFISEVGCDKTTSCREMMPIVEACALDPVQDVRIFEEKLATAFASNPECESVQVVLFKNPYEGSKVASDALHEKHNWVLGLDYNPGARKQKWWMERPPYHGAQPQGEGTPDEIAKKVCTIVSQRGAAILSD
jgi:hypothetical protein